MAVLALVRHDQHRRVIERPLHVLPRRAPPEDAALVVAPVMEEEKDFSCTICIGRLGGGGRGGDAYLG